MSDYFKEAEMYAEGLSATDIRKRVRELMDYYDTLPLGTKERIKYIDIAGDPS